MLGLKVNKKDAEKARLYLESHALLSTQHKLYGDNSFIYLPINGQITGKNRRLIEGRLSGSFINFKFENSLKKSKYRKILHDNLGKKYAEVTKSYDVIGNIALINAKGGPAKQIAKAIMATNKSVETVISKGGAVSGKYRVRKYRHVLGKRNFVATYRENGAVFNFDMRKTFFSSRLAFDRLRISKLVKEKENVVVMFAGMGPFAIQIARMHRNAKVVGIELNRNAYNYMKQNIRLNHVTNVIAELGDVNIVANKYKGFADRIIMPLPKDSHNFLDAALKVARKKAVIHYYAFGDKETAFNRSIKKIKEFMMKHGKKAVISNRRVVRQYSPKEIEIVLDVIIK